MAVRKAKKKNRVVKEFVNAQFKEVKKENDNGNDAEEEEADNAGFENGNGFVSGGERAAPVLQAKQDASLEQVARTAPTARTGTAETANTANQDFYSANYTARYENQNYEARQEQEQVVQPTVRAAGSLIDRNFDFRNLRRMSASQSGEQTQAGQENWVGGVPEDRRYQPKDDVLKEDIKRIDKRRRMA